MGIFDNNGGYVYAAPMPSPWEVGPYQPCDPQPPRFPLTPERAREIIDRGMHMLDEFEIMRSLDKLDDDARLRVLDWLKARCDMTPRHK